VLAAEPLAEFDVAFEEADPFDGGLGRGDAVRVFFGADRGERVGEVIVGFAHEVVVGAVPVAGAGGIIVYSQGSVLVRPRVAVFAHRPGPLYEWTPRAVLKVRRSPHRNLG
jgi:hypothetical protein